MKDETLRELAKLAAQKLHTDPSTLIDVHMGEDLYVIEFYDHKSIFDAETKAISFGEEEFAEYEDLDFFDDLLQDELYLHQ